MEAIFKADFLRLFGHWSNCSVTGKHFSVAMDGGMIEWGREHGRLRGGDCVRVSEAESGNVGFRRGQVTGRTALPYTEFSSLCPGR